ncbi:MAG: hypothetical protein DRH93_17250 [Deltaproteobacteria bacterium]|nr:MAG: hypothetical protein DRH93_17250 [Deltaproteobacteria bacterium]
MEEQFTKLQNLGVLMRDHGLQMILALTVLIVGLFATKWIVKTLKKQLGKVTKNAVTISIVSNSIGVILLAVVIVAAAMEMGAKPGPLIALLMIICLVVIGSFVVFRPLIPTLPFKVGNTVKAAGLLGKIEATTLLNTRMRTFDGKTFFVPNRQILDDIVINYQFTETRRVKVDVSIRYDQDLAKAKRVLEALMIRDARVLAKPAPQVYVLNLSPSSVDIGGRCWVKNPKYWVAKCDLLEKTKFAFDNEGIKFAYPQLDVHHYERQEKGYHVHQNEDEILNEDV